MKAIITVVGKDRVGIIAAVSAELAGVSVNILDISQTIMQDNFTMMMSVDLAKSSVSQGAEGPAQRYRREPGPGHQHLQRRAV